MPRRLFLPLALAVASFASAAESPPPARPGPLDSITTLHQVSLAMNADELEVLENETFVQRGRGGAGGGPAATEDDIELSNGRFVHIGGGFGGYFPWVRASIGFGPVTGLAIHGVGLRFKGNGSYNPGAGLHRNLKVKTDFFGGKTDWAGLETLNFNAGGRDSSRMRETIAFAVFRAAGVPASRTAYAEVSYTVPGVHSAAYGGLFTVIENINKQFLKHALPPGTGLLMKPERMNGGVGYYGEDWSSYVPYYRPERTATATEQSRVIEFARLVNSSSAPEFRARIEAILDVDEFLRFLAVNALIQSRDSYLSGRHNYFIYLDPKDNKFRFIPWDEDGSFAGGGGGGFNFVGGPAGGFAINGAGPAGSGDLMRPWSSDNPLAYWLLDEPVFAARYQAIVRDIVAKVFNRDALLNLVSSLEPVIRQPLVQEAHAMMLRGESNNSGSGTSLRPWVDQRVESVNSQIATWPK